MAVSVISLMDNFAVTLFILLNDIKRYFSTQFSLFISYPTAFLQLAWKPAVERIPCPSDIEPMAITNTSPIVTKTRASSTTLTSLLTATTTAAAVVYIKQHLDDLYVQYKIPPFISRNIHNGQEDDIDHSIP
ncbi:hypothetical protein K0M31_002268 [Melipona bicolor]|uniref:Uncharacterized protein n=1 Tax=Melipona bicolor TaxID=60889 RepID=A0AA40GHF6_9HYME|nr:hypothetical protein K0M31_002268 [Melipona bicolor]